MNKIGYLILAPNSPWIECQIVNVSESGLCVEVGALAIPELFGMAFTAGGEVIRICALVWRRGQLVGARFVTVKQLRQSADVMVD